MKGSTRKKTGSGNGKGGARDQSTGHGFRYDGLGQPRRETDPWAKKADERLGRAIQKTEMGSGRALQWEHAERPKEEPGVQRGGRRVSLGRGWRHGGREVTGEHGSRPVQSGPRGKRLRRALCSGMLWFDLCFSFKFYFIYLAMLGLSWSARCRARWPGVELGPSASGRRVLATGPPGTSLTCVKGSLWLLYWDGTTGRKG